MKTIRKWLKVTFVIAISSTLAVTGGYALVKIHAFLDMVFEGIILREQTLLWIVYGLCILAGSFSWIASRFLIDDPDFD